MKTLNEIIEKANELNSKYPNLLCEVVTIWGGKYAIKVVNSDKAKALTEMYNQFTFTF
jgi:hypothetical protein